MLSRVMYGGWSQAHLVGAEESIAPASPEWGGSQAGVAPASGIAPCRRANFLKKKFCQVPQRK